MNLSPEQNVILMHLLRHRLQTEHELASAVALATNRKVVDVQPRIGQLLIELKHHGLVWAGELFTAKGTAMWAGTLTQNGKNIAEELQR